MDRSGTLLQALGGEDGCRLLSKRFYARVAKDPVLRPLFPGKSLRCAIEEFAAFLIQFLGGDEAQSQFRHRISLQESHARFALDATHRAAWLAQMRAALEEMPVEPVVRAEIGRFFLHSSGYVIGKREEFGEAGELAARWKDQRDLDKAVAAIWIGLDDEAILLASRFANRPSMFVGLLARMMQTRRAGLNRFALDAVRRDSALGVARYNGRTLLHHAAGAGCVDVVAEVLRQGADPNIEDNGGHSVLYRVANECSTPAGPVLVRMLLKAGADVNSRGSVTRATALHMAARRGHIGIARALIEGGAATDLRDTKGDTPLQRAINCRRREVAEYLREVAG